MLFSQINYEISSLVILWVIDIRGLIHVAGIKVGTKFQLGLGINFSQRPFSQGLNYEKVRDS